MTSNNDRGNSLVITALFIIGTLRGVGGTP